MKREWKKTSYEVPGELNAEIASYCAINNVSRTQLINTLFIALVTGDIQVKKDFNRQLRKKISPTMRVIDAVGVELFDKEGNRVNPSLEDYDCGLD